MDAGSALSGHYDTEYSKGEIMIQFMNLLGYDAISIGSMDFKYKMDEILYLNDKAEFPILSANLVSKQDKSLVFDAYTIIESSGRNIAIIGISPYPLEEGSESDIIEKYETIDPIEAINKIIDDLRLKANIIIVLSSAGREIDEKIAKSIDAVDIIVAGSSNQITMEPVVIKREEKSDALIVESQVLGKKLGKLTVKFSSVGKIKEFEGELIKLDPEVEDEPDILKILKEYLEQMKK